MKTKMSKALQEVWEMKDAAYEETKHLHGTAYFNYIREQVINAFPPEVHSGRKEATKRIMYKNSLEGEASFSQIVAVREG
jgi:hypothetical protein